MPETFVVLGEPPQMPRLCQYCGKRADLHDLDGTWCSPECRRYDRESEITIWRRWSE